MVDVLAKYFYVVLDENVLLGGTNWKNAQHLGIGGGVLVVLRGKEHQLLCPLAGHTVQMGAHYDHWATRGT